MAGVFRSSISKLRFGSTGLCKVKSANKVTHFQVAWISTKEERLLGPPRPEPFPYESKSFNLWYQLFDNTTFRFDDNTKLIVVEGPPAMGKGELCKKLANELDMLYVPQTYLEDYYVREFDFDLRTIDDKLPESCRTVEVPTFLKNPTLRNGGVMQQFFYNMRYKKFIQILAHILSTGQGVVTERSPWSDQCFADAMHSNGYISDNALNVYNTVVLESLHEIMRPHLVIYLDAPVKNVLERIKKRNKPEEANSKVLNEKFLTDLEHNYKFKFLKNISEHANILIYDYSEGGDFETIVEDITSLDFTDKQDGGKFTDWDLRTDVMWTNKRRDYCENEQMLLNYIYIEDMSATEVVIPASDEIKRHFALKEHAPRRVWDSFYFPDKKNIKKLLQPIEY